MINKITEKQNLPINITLLKAQRALYSSAKNYAGLQLILTVFIMVAISFIYLIYGKGWLGLPVTDLTWLVTSVSFLVLLLDSIWLTPLIESKKEMAAKIQQEFDSNVLGIQWSKGFLGKKVDREVIEDWCYKFKGDENKLRDWYCTKIESLPLTPAKICCQSENCWWDGDLRKKYNTLIILITLMAAIASFILSISLDYTMQKFFVVFIAPLLPFVTIAFRTIHDNNKSIERLKNLKSDLNDLWEQLLRQEKSDNDANVLIEGIQLGIFTNRKDSPLIFDFVYWLQKNKKEQIFNKTVSQYLDEYLEREPSMK